MGKKKLTQAEKAEALASERDVLVEEAPQAPSKGYTPRDFRSDFAAPVEQPWSSSQYFGWASAHPGAQPPPAVPGKRPGGGPWEPDAPVPNVITEQMIDAVLYGGGWYDAERWPKTVRVSLDEADERAGSGRRADGSYGHMTERERCGKNWMETALYDPMDFSNAPWGQRCDYQAAKNEAVRILEARTVKARSRGMVTTDGLAARNTVRCQGCSETVDQLMWSEAHARFLCRECGPDLEWLHPPVGRHG